MKIGSFDNVVYAENSAYPFGELNENIFLLKLFAYLKDQLKEKFDDFEFDVLSSHKKNIVPLCQEVPNKKRKVLIFISEETGVDPSYLSKKYFAVFKSSLPKEKFRAENIFPFPLGCVNEVPEYPVNPINERKYDVFFSGSFNKFRADLYWNLSKLRKYVPQQLFNLLCRLSTVRKYLVRKQNFDPVFQNSIIRFTSFFKGGFSPVEYGQILANSKIILCPKGGVNTECFRHYESMRAGSIIISEKLPDVEFYRNSPIIQVENWKVGIATAKQLLRDPVALQALQQKTIQWWQEKCSEKGTANYVHNCLLKIDNLN